MGHDEVALLIGLPHTLRRPPGHRLVVEGVEPAGPLQIGDAGDPGHGHELIHRHRVHHKGGDTQLVADLLGQYGTQIGGVFSVDGIAHILHHAVIDPVGTAGNGLHQSAPAGHGGERLQLDALFCHCLQDELLPIGKLVEHLTEGLQILRRVGDVGFEQLLVVLKDRDLRGGAARIDDQDLHVPSLTFRHCSTQ